MSEEQNELRQLTGYKLWHTYSTNTARNVNTIAITRTDNATSADHANTERLWPHGNRRIRTKNY